MKAPPLHLIKDDPVGDASQPSPQPPPPPPPKRSAAVLTADAEHRLVPAAPIGEPAQTGTPVIAPAPQTSRRKAKRSRTQPPRPVSDEALAAEKWAQMADLERRVTDIQDAEVLAMLNLGFRV